MAARTSPPSPHRATGTLDERDVTALRLLADNASRAEIARTLGCSASTVDRLVSGLRAHYGVATTVEAVVRAVRSGVV